MQQVTPIMPSHDGAHYPAQPNARPTEAARCDLFAPDPISPGSRLGTLDELRPRARARAPERAARQALPTPITKAGPKAGRSTTLQVDATLGTEPFANTNLDAGASPLHRGGARYGAPSAILVGEAGTNLVLSWLQSLGIPAQIAMPGIAYDLIADVAGLDLLRIQVKTRSTPKGQSCSFNMTRGCYYSKAGMFNYGRDDFDLAAFVCLSIGAVFFCAGPVERISVRRAWMQSSTIARDSFDLALHAIQRRRYADQAAWLASMNDRASVLNLADDPVQKSASPVLPCPAPNPVPTLMPISTPIASSVPTPVATLVPTSVPAPVPASRPGAKLEPDLLQASEPKRRPVRMPAPPRMRPQKAPPPIPPSQDALDAVDWDEALAMFDDHGDFDAIIPI